MFCVSVQKNLFQPNRTILLLEAVGWLGQTASWESVYREVSHLCCTYLCLTFTAVRLVFMVSATSEQAPGFFYCQRLLSFWSFLIWMGNYVKKNTFNFDFCTFLLHHAHILFSFDSEKALQLNSLSLTFPCFFIWLYVPQA